MNRHILIPVTAPALVIGLLLCGTCLVSAWYIHRLQRDMTASLSENLASLQAAQDLQIRVRQLRFHSFVYFMDPQPERLRRVEEDHQNFEQALRAARHPHETPEERACLQAIEAAYREYREDLARLREEAGRGKRSEDFGRLADTHPVTNIVEPCQQLLRLNQDALRHASQEAERVGGQANLVMLLVGIVGPLGGLVTGLGMARALSRSICRLSVRVQDIAQRLDQDVVSVNLVADGDIRGLDQQLGHVLGRVEEVTERMQRHQRDMLRAEQLAAVGQLAASVAHEVRNPLTAVKMLVELALRPRNPKPLTPDDLRVIHGEVTRLEQTVQNFLDFARLPTPRRADCDLRDVIARAAELVRARAGQQSVAVTVRCPEAPVPGCVDPDQFHTVLVNLCLNALDAMPGGGRLEVRLEAPAGGETCLAVLDSGPGIAPEMAGRLFTPFASTKPTGTGLGLSLSRRIVEEHGGRLTAEDRPEGGACFTIHLPTTAGATCPANGLGRLAADRVPSAL